MTYKAVIVGLALSQSLAPPLWAAPAAEGRAGASPATAESGTAASGTVSYGQDFFAQYDVTNAEEILRRIPGAASVLDSASPQNHERGFGSRGEQVLINGKRMAGKNQIQSTLRRLQVANIERVELIRGTEAEIDVQSEGLIVNIVLKEGVGTGAGSWQLDARFNDHGKFNVDGLVNYSNSLGSLDYIVGLERNLWVPRGFQGGDWSTRTREEFYFFPNGAVQEDRDQSFRRQHNKFILTANLAYNVDNGDRLRLNGLFEPRDVNEIDTTAITRFNAAGAPVLSATDFHERHSGWVMRWEVGGDYVRAIGNGSLNTLLIYSSLYNPIDEFRNQAVGATVSEINRNLTTQLNTEAILRSSYSWPVTAGQTLELGGEGARNTLSQNFRPFFDLDRNGRVEEITIPTARAKVQELRGEAFANHNWTVTNDLTLESSLNFEFSKITNNYPFSPTANYKFLKPRADMRYDLTEADQVRLKAERTVSQLQFSNFVPSFDVIDNEIDAGNPDLKPEKALTFELAYQHRMPNRQGLLEGRAFYKDISDHIDKFIIRREVSGELVSATGNIGNARVIGAEVKAGIRLAWLGLPDVGIDARYLRQRSRATDPFTGRHRSLTAYWDDEVDFSLRHDVTAWGMSYGAKFTATEGQQTFSDARVLRVFERGSKLEAFVEKKLWAGLTGRVDAYGLMPNHNREYQSRILYTRDIIDGAISRTERYVEIRDRRFIVSLRGRF